MALEPGDTLLNGQYRILRQIGRGGFGFVYLAQETPLDEKVAIKELIPELVGDERVLKRFLVEAKATRHLTHDRIVRTHHVFDQGGHFYIVMEYMPGGSLEERLQRGPLSVTEAIRLGAEVCSGLDYAHQQGVVHCDLKPANILFAADGSAKVADFGIAFVSDQMLTRTWQTTAGFVAGTLPYMSPEQTDGVRDDPRLDVYALGAVLYRALTDRTYLDFDQRETPRAQANNVQSIFERQPIPPSAHNPQIPAWLDATIQKALAKRPDDRFSNANELRTSLLQPARLARPVAPSVPIAQPEAMPVSPGPAAVPTSLPQPHRSSRPVWFWPVAGATAILCVLVVVATTMLFSDGDRGSTVVPAESTVPSTSLPTISSSQPTLIPTLPPPTHTPAPTQVRASDTVYRIGIYPEFPDFEFFDDSGKLVGFDPDLMTAIAEAAGFQFEFVTTDWDGLLDQLAQGEFDAVISAVTITEDREEMVDFGRPYFNAGPIIVVRSADVGQIATPQDLDSRRAGVDRDTFSDEWLSGNTQAQIVRFNGPSQPFEALVNGDVDAVVSDGVTAALTIAYMPEWDLSLVGRPVADEFLGIAVNPGQVDLLMAISRGLELVRANGTYDQLLMKWFGASEPFSP